MQPKWMLTRNQFKDSSIISRRQSALCNNRKDSSKTCRQPERNRILGKGKLWWPSWNTRKSASLTTLIRIALKEFLPMKTMQIWRRECRKRRRRLRTLIETLTSGWRASSWMCKECTTAFKDAKEWWKPSSQPSRRRRMTKRSLVSSPQARLLSSPSWSPSRRRKATFWRYRPQSRSPIRRSKTSRSSLRSWPFTTGRLPSPSSRSPSPNSTWRCWIPSVSKRSRMRTSPPHSSILYWSWATKNDRLSNNYESHEPPPPLLRSSQNFHM